MRRQRKARYSARARMRQPTNPSNKTRGKHIQGRNPRVSPVPKRGKGTFRI